MLPLCPGPKAGAAGSDEREPAVRDLSSRDDMRFRGLFCKVSPLGRVPSEIPEEERLDDLRQDTQDLFPRGSGGSEQFPPETSPELRFPAERNTSEAVTVGKWYCPFIFLKEGAVSEQLKSSRYYRMTLEQQWERVFAAENDDGARTRTVAVDVVVEGEVVMVGERGRKVGVVVGRRNTTDGEVWFDDGGEVGGRVGLREEIVERMRWEERRVGWKEEEGGGEVRLRKEEEFKGNNTTWVRFGYYVLVERFVLVRMNGSFVMSYEFRHLHNSRPKWD